MFLFKSNCIFDSNENGQQLGLDGIGLDQRVICELYGC